MSTLFGAQALAWWRAGERFGAATVVATWRSAPRPVGSCMLRGPAGEVVGNVSGGCVESAVLEELAAGSIGLHRYGVSDGDAFAVGLTCGGVLDVFTETVDQHSFPDFEDVARDVAMGQPVALVTVLTEARVGLRIVLRANGVTGTLGSARLDAAVREDARGLLDQGRSQVLRYGSDGERCQEDCAVFIRSFAPPVRMIIFGAIDFAAELLRLGVGLGYRVTVCDARAIFATKARFPEAHEVTVAWPHRYLEDEHVAGRIDERTVVCVLTHDPKFDVPLLEFALGLPLGYVGAMGSRRTQADRASRLAELGVGVDALARLHAPIGLDIGARTPAETALSIAAEIVAVRHRASGRALRELDGPIHPA